MCTPTKYKFMIITKIFIANNKTTNITNLPINNVQFTVISEVNFEVNFRYFGWKKCPHMNACFSKTFNELFTQKSRPHIIIQDTYFDTFLCLFYENIRNGVSQLVTAHNVIQ